MLALLLHLLVLFLEVLDLSVLNLEFFERLIVFRVGVGSLDPVLFLFALDLLEDFGQFLLLGLVAGHFICQFLCFVHLLNVLH